jgi:exonuclease III
VCFFRKSLKITKYIDITFKSFEHLDLSVAFGNFNTRMVLVYRPPLSKKNNLTPTTFFTEFSDLIEDLTVFDKPFFIAGDFNLHIDNKSNPDTVKFLNILDSTNMIQMGPTHR